MNSHFQKYIKFLTFFGNKKYMTGLEFQMDNRLNCKLQTSICLFFLYNNIFDVKH